MRKLLVYDRLIAEAERYKTEYISGRLSLQTVIKLYNSSDMSESFEVYT